MYEDFLQDVLPYPVGNIHPRFWGWVIGTGTVLGAHAELLAGAMNTNTGGLDHHSANHVELQVIRWLKQIFRFPESASGLELILDALQRAPEEIKLLLDSDEDFHGGA